MVENVKFSNDDKFPIPIAAETSYLTNARQIPPPPGWEWEWAPLEMTRRIKLFA